MATRFAHILVVDDDADVCGVLSAMLEEMGYHASTAKGAAEARRVLAAERIDLVVTDDWMFGEAGSSLADYVASVGVPALLISGRDTSVVRFEHSSRLFLRKPFHLEEFHNKIAEALGRPKDGPDES